MKKNLIALAIFGAFTGAAFAQSNVTLYGIVDGGLQYNGTNVLNPVTRAIDSKSQFGVDGGYVAGNRWGLRGSEALGGGTSAIFQLEAGFNIDTGMSGQGGRLFGRQAYLGLSNTGAGSLVFGRIATFSSGTGAFDMIGAVDPFGTGWGLNSMGSTFISAGALRVDNTVAYVTPTWGGFAGGVAYSFNVAGNEVPGSSNNTTALALGAKYANGPFYAAITYDTISYATTAAGSGPDQKHLQVGATWDFKVAKIYGAYAKQDNIRNAINPIDGIVIPIAATGLPTFSNDAFMVGASVPLFGGSLLASYQSSSADGQNVTTAAGVVNFDPDYSVYAIGYLYPVSSRTSLYAGYGQRDGSGTLAKTFDKEQFALGVNHKF